MDIVERVARAIAEQRGLDPDERVPPSGLPAWKYNERNARAAISEVLSALEEPSESVREAVKYAYQNAKQGDDIRALEWQAMLSQVRKEIEG